MLEFKYPQKQKHKGVLSMNIIQEISEIVVSKRMKEIEKVMLEGGNISELTTEIEKVVNGIGRELTRHILEETD